MKPKPNELLKRLSFFALVAVCSVAMYFAWPHIDQVLNAEPPPRVERPVLDINRFWSLSTAPAGDVPVISVITKGGWSFVILEDGSLWRLYSQVLGYLSDSSHEQHYSPVWIMDNVATIDIGHCRRGFRVMMILTRCGTLWNLEQDLRWNFNTTSLSPTKVMDNVIAFSIGSWGNVMVITSDGVLWGWGYNQHGQLGNGTTDNIIGQLHDGTNPNFPFPARIMEDVIYVSAIGNRTMAITSDNVLWGWGSNWGGQLSDSTTENFLYPIRIKDDVIAISAGAGYTMAITLDGSLWGCAY